MLQSVKSPRLWALGLGLLIATPAAQAQKRREPSMLLGAGPTVTRSPVETDPWLPSGARQGSHRPRPVSVEPPGCAFGAPVCVHRGTASDELAQAALQAMQRAYRRLVFGLGLPAPLSDYGAGGSDALDLYLLPGERHDLWSEPEAADSSAFDRSAAYCGLTAPTAAWLDRDATLCVAEAIARRLDAAETPHVRRAYATHVWNIVGTTTSADLEAIDEVQAHPERALLTRERDRHSEGSAIFFDHAEWSFGSGGPGALATALIAQSASKTRPSWWQWDNEPDLLDVLRRTLEDKPRRMAEVLGDLAVTRAFLGERDDGVHAPTLGWTGAFGRVRFDWSIEFSSLPRRVASARPIEPTGAIYVWLSLDKVPKGATLGFQAEWEPPVPFQWVLVRVDAQGRELSRLPAPFREKSTQAEQTLVNLEGAAGILIVGTNLGGVDLAHPFDPDVAPHEPHGCTVYLAKL